MILNLTQHAASAEQLAAGVVDFDAQDAVWPRKAMTFDTLPEAGEVLERARCIAAYVAECFPDTDAAMIGGAPFFMGALEAALKSRGIKPVYAFSVRESVEETQSDGSVRKTAVFRHKGFVEV